MALVNERVTRAKSSRYGPGHFLALSAVLLVFNLAGALYTAADVPMPGGTAAICYILLTAVVYSWFKRFAADHDISTPFDIGWFLYVAWWAIVPYYLFRVRGVKAIWTILTILCTYLATYGISVLAFYAVV